MSCYICEMDTDNRDDLKHYNFYLIGSEGIWLCLKCRIIVGKHIKGLHDSYYQGKMDAYKQMKKRK